MAEGEQEFAMGELDQMENASDSKSGETSFRRIVTNSIQYWEPRRIIYNVVLAVIVGVYFVRALPESWKFISLNAILSLALLAVLANLCYCAAYIADLFVQISALRNQWLKYRWILFGIGLVFAGILTRFFALGFFESGHVH